MLLFSVSLMLVMAFASPVVAGELAACTLLTSSEIEGVTGGHVSAAEPMQLDDIGTGPNRVMKVIGCIWGLSNQMGQLTITWFRGPLTDEEIAQLIKVSKNSPDIEDMKKANYKQVSKDFTNAWCSILTPPDADEGHLLLSICAGGINRQGLSMAFSSHNTSLTINQVKTLLDKAGERVQ